VASPYVDRLSGSDDYADPMAPGRWVDSRADKLLTGYISAADEVSKMGKQGETDRRHPCQYPLEMVHHPGGTHYF
jgi:hypothetical protein